jgi:antitoxin ParD1/3/4/toxin ParE1/3/4
MSGYAFHPEAFNDLDQIWEYIAERNLDAADGVIADISDALTTLVRSPHIGRRRPDLTSRPLRFKLVRDYLIAYVPDERPLWVVAGASRQPQSACHGRDSQRPRGRAIVVNGSRARAV